MRSIWKGSISFGLVNIPIALFPATKEEDLKFHMLRKSDLSPINFKRVAQADGKTVEWSEIVKGYEYEKGKFVILQEEDFKRVDVEATHSIDIVDFVELDEINPMHFSKPYYIEPGRGADRAYSLLRSVLVDTGKVGIAKVVIRTKQHLAAVKPNGKLLVLELMHFDKEIAPASGITAPSDVEQGKKELEMAKALVNSMTHPWNAKEYEDEYTAKLLEVIDEKIASGGKEVPVKTKGAAAKAPSNVIDLVSILQESINKSTKGGKKANTGKVGATKENGKPKGKGKLKMMPAYKKAA